MAGLSSPVALVGLIQLGTDIERPLVGVVSSQLRFFHHLAVHRSGRSAAASSAALFVLHRIERAVCQIGPRPCGIVFPEAVGPLMMLATLLVFGPGVDARCPGVMVIDVPPLPDWMPPIRSIAVSR